MWKEVEPPETAGDVDAAAGGEPGTTELTGTSFRGSGNPPSPSTAISRGGSFGGGASITPNSSSSSSNNNNSRGSSSIGNSSSNNSSPEIEDGTGATNESPIGNGYAELRAELPTTEANRLQSWAWRGDAISSSSRLRVRPERYMDGAEEKVIAEEKGPEASPEASPSLRPLAVVILGEAMEETDKFSSCLLYTSPSPRDRG